MVQSQRTDSKRPHVVLVKPPLRVTKASYSTLACPPLALALVAAALEKSDCEVTIIDALGEAPRRYTPTANSRFVRLGLSDDEIVARLPRSATYIGVTAMFTEEWPLIRSVIQAIRKARPEAIIVAGGEHASAAPKFTIEDSAAVDACVIGEGENTAVELAWALHEGRPVADVAGVVTLEQGRLVRGERRARQRDLDALPWPAWHLLPLENYLDHGLGYGIGRNRSLPLLATRGCPYTCTFCSNEKMWGIRWSARDPADVVAEIRAAVQRYAITNVDFYDLTAVLQRRWILRFCRLMAEADLKVTLQIPSGTRSEVLDEEVLRALKGAGCHHIVYAPESGSPSLLKRVKKRICLDRMTESMITAVKVGMTVKCNFIIGFPDETEAEIRETIAYCAQLAKIGVQDVNLGPFCPYPGSDLYDELVAEGALPVMSDAYCDTLAMYSDLSRSLSFSRHLSSRKLHAYRIAGMALFYGSSTLRRPIRLFEIVRNIKTGKHQTRLDRALSDMTRRFADSLLRRAN